MCLCRRARARAGQQPALPPVQHGLPGGGLLHARRHLPVLQRARGADLPVSTPTNLSTLIPCFVAVRAVTTVSAASGNTPAGRARAATAPAWPTSSRSASSAWRTIPAREKLHKCAACLYYAGPGRNTDGLVILQLQSTSPVSTHSPYFLKTESSLTSKKD